MRQRGRCCAPASKFQFNNIPGWQVDTLSRWFVAILRWALQSWLDNMCLCLLALLCMPADHFGAARLLHDKVGVEWLRRCHFLGASSGSLVWPWPLQWRYISLHVAQLLHTIQYSHFPPHYTHACSCVSRSPCRNVRFVCVCVALFPRTRAQIDLDEMGPFLDQCSREVTTRFGGPLGIMTQIVRGSLSK